MKHVSTHIEDDIAERFAALARGHGGKSALLRRLIKLAVDGQGAEHAPTMPDPVGRAVKLSLRLSANEVSAVNQAAHDRGMKPSQWLRSVVRVRLGAGTQYSATELHELRALTNQVRKIGVNLNQVVRAANEARLEHAPFNVDTAALVSAREEVARAIKALHQMARGNVRAWEGDGHGE